MTAPSALIGGSGYVGGFLAKRMPFTRTFRRSDIDGIRDETYDLVVCAGMPAAKWLANQNPVEDSENTDRLMDALKSAKTDSFVLISTVDIYQGHVSCDEMTTPQPDHTYGRNRLRLERFVKANFPNYHILRLPALFGDGLKKNALFDLMHDNQVEKINPSSEFQWYDLEWLPGDIRFCMEKGIREANLFTEPVAMETIRRSLFPRIELNPSAPVARYNHKTILSAFHGGAYGETGYRAQSDEVLKAMHRYVESVRGG